MTRYLILVAEDPGAWEDADEAAREEYFAAHGRFEAFVDAHGRRVSSAALAGPDMATTIRHEGEQAVVNDGPFAELAEIIGGYYDIEVPDLDTAIAAGKLLPRTYAVEIRPTIVIDGV